MHGILHARELELDALYYQAYEKTDKKLAALQVSQKEMAELVTEHLRKAKRDLSSEDVGVIERHLDLLRSLTSAVQDVADTFGRMDSLAIPTGIERKWCEVVTPTSPSRSMPPG